MKKTLIGISLIAAMAVSFASCGDSTTTNEDSSNSSSSNSSSSDTNEDTNNDEDNEETEDEDTKEDEAEETEAKVDAAAPAVDEDPGFTEYPIFEDEEVGFLNVSAVYFQPVPMTDGNSIDDYNIHLEADISALPNTLGFGVGDWVPYLTVDYLVTNEDDGSEAASGTFMEMSASDGPHYGANIALPDAGTYTVKFTIHSPAENNYLLHTDAETGPGGSFDDYFGDGNLEVVFEGWDYIPQEW